ncbi:MAG: HD domain-containing protein [Candidatus Lokiarchaeota archaeon]|nr:HD domain-containing protein [Candidatus Lokiarchaeota archaeon]
MEAPLMAKTHKSKSTLKDRVRRMFKNNELCTLAFDALEEDIEVQTLLEDSNRMAIDRLGYSDHGHIHSLIVTMNGMRLFRILTDVVSPTIVQEETGTIEDAQLIVLLGCYLHDVGMSVHREGHHEFSVSIALPILNRILAKVYPKDLHKQVHVRGHVLHAIQAHDKVISPSTIEAGIVGIADALDMTKGRARIPFEAGSVNIHSASAMAIERVTIHRGKDRTVRIEVSMSNASGIFQIQELLEKKIESAEQLTGHIELYAVMTGSEDRILSEQLRIL